MAFGLTVLIKAMARNIYIRSPPNNNPIKDITSDAIMCNVNNRKVAKSVQVTAGDELTIEWHHDNRDDDIIDLSHKVPVQVYLAPSDVNDWTKIFSDSYTSSWAVERLVAAHGQHSIIVPNIPAGDYLLRAEINALHEADSLFTQNSARGAQFYPSCIQITVTSAGSQVLPGGTVFPGTYTDSIPGVQFNIYGTDPTTYVAPGPAVWSGAKGGSIKQVGTAGQASVSSATGTPGSVATTSVVATITKASTVVPTTTSVKTTTAVVTTSSSSAATSVKTTTVVATTSSPAATSVKPTTVVTTSSPVSAAVTSSSSSSTLVSLYSQCGGKGFTGSTSCVQGAACIYVNDWYSQCLVGSNTINVPVTTTSVVTYTPSAVSGAVPLYSQCGGSNYKGATTCGEGVCRVQNEWYSQCVPATKRAINVPVQHKRMARRSRLANGIY
ncbi:carbohydrate-binding module family 1 protein [Sphaerobolus stellatus SS14]|uniref:AA9 family lytic polysaccharide monooxygenase n=1 Tax=Sphaerobolus stellatus (strain SS14) TaxID=990650 RepID=A0A0C9W312_SPHS4|nr:carbohydrate-binding module family 1 protein [Sphaerobolus stellatus SS14]